MDSRLWSTVLVIVNTFGLSCAQDIPPSVLRGCNSTLDSTNQMIESPELRRITRGKALHCYYIVEFNTTDDNSIIKVEFNSFNLGSIVNHSVCESAYFQIIDGGNESYSSSLPVGKFCGELQSSSMFYSETPSIIIIFHTEEFTKDTYFKINYELVNSQHLQWRTTGRGDLIPDSYCDRIFSGPISQIVLNEVQSPGYNGVYLPNLTCSYLISPTNASHYQLILNLYSKSEFDVGSRTCDDPMLCEIRSISFDCSTDYVAIYDGNSKESQEITRLCGKGYLKAWPQIIPSSNTLYLEFVSHIVKSPLNKGFRFSLSSRKIMDTFPGRFPPYLITNGTCSYTFLSSENIAGVFGSVSHWYPKNTKCTFRFIGNSDECVKISFAKFHGDKYCRNYLIIYDSHYADSNKFAGKYCSYWFPKVQYSTKSNLFIEFHSLNGSLDGSEMIFSAAYEFKLASESVVTDDCKVFFNSIDNKKGTFHIPRNMLLWRNRRLNCTYNFKGKSFEQVLITVQSSIFPTSSSCSRTDEKICTSKHNDGKFIEQAVFYDSDGSYMGCVCRNETFPMVFISLKNAMTVSIELESWTDVPPDIATLNFTASFQFVTYECIVPHPQRLEGIILTPNYPNNVTLPIRCRWNIDVSPKRYLFVLVDDFDLSGECQNNFLRIYQTPNNNENALDICKDNFKKEWVLQEMILDEFFSKNITRPVTFEIQTNKPGAKLQLFWNEVSAKSKDLLELECPHMCPDLITCIEKELVCNNRRNCPTFIGKSEENDISCQKKSSFIDEETLILICCAGALGFIVVVWLIVCMVQQWQEYCS